MILALKNRDRTGPKNREIGKTQTLYSIFSGGIEQWSEQVFYCQKPGSNRILFHDKNPGPKNSIRFYWDFRVPPTSFMNLASIFVCNYRTCNLSFRSQKSEVTRCNVLALHSLPGSAGYRLLHPRLVNNT